VESLTVKSAAARRSRSNVKGENLNAAQRAALGLGDLAYTGSDWSGPVRVASYAFMLGGAMLLVSSRRTPRRQAKTNPR
jgi:hypothetical protein